MKTDMHFLSYLAHFFLQSEMFQTKVVNKLKTHILCSINFFRERAVCKIMWGNNVERDSPQVAICRLRFCMLDN
jgi:hypothetical protein